VACAFLRTRRTPNSLPKLGEICGNTAESHSSTAPFPPPPTATAPPNQSQLLTAYYCSMEEQEAAVLLTVGHADRRHAAPVTSTKLHNDSNQRSSRRAGYYTSRHSPDRQAASREHHTHMSLQPTRRWSRGVVRLDGAKMLFVERRQPHGVKSLAPRRSGSLDEVANSRLTKVYVSALATGEMPRLQFVVEDAETKLALQGFETTKLYCERLKLPET
jgi:hypothetical protein